MTLFKYLTWWNAHSDDYEVADIVRCESKTSAKFFYLDRWMTIFTNEFDSEYLIEHNGGVWSTSVEDASIIIGGFDKFI